MAKTSSPISRALLALVLCAAPALLPRGVSAASLDGKVRVEVNDPTGALSGDIAGRMMTVQAWFKISVPSDVTIGEDMTILASRKSGSASDPHAYLIFFNIYSGHVEFSARGASGAISKILVERPYLDRWYHVAVVRQGDTFSGYLDGRQVFTDTVSVGDIARGDGVAIGGWGNAKYLRGEVQEVSIYQTAVGPEFIVQHMFTDQPAIAAQKGYFKLAYSTNSADHLKNFAPTPVPEGTENAEQKGDGKLEFEETNQAGEQSYFDAQKNGTQGYIVPLSGAFSLNLPILSRPTPGITFELRFGYSSANSYGGYKLGGTDPYAAGPVGRGWRHIFETRLLPAQNFSPLADTDTVGLMNWDGSIETWDADKTPSGDPTGTYHTRSKAYRGELAVDGARFRWTTPERLVYVFNAPGSGAATMRGRLVSIEDFNKNTVRLLWDETLGRINGVVDSAGGRWDFAYSGNLLQKISFGDWAVNLNYADDRLTSFSKTNTSGAYTAVNTAWRFEYHTAGTSSNLLSQVIDPRGNTNVAVVYDKYGRKTEVRDALGRLTKFEYDQPGRRQIRTTDPEGQATVETFDRKHRLLTRKDPLGNETKFEYDEAGNAISITEPLGWVTWMAYDERANLTIITNALGEVSHRRSHPFFNKGVEEVDPAGWTNRIVIEDTTGNLLQNHDDLGTLSGYTYTTNGLPETATDGNGNVTRFQYDTNGFLVLRTDAAGYRTGFAYNDLGWKLAETNALDEVTRFAYDLNGNVVRTTDALSRTITRAFDANGNLVQQSDAKGKFTLYAFDAANQRTQMVDRATNPWRYEFEKRGALTKATDPLGNTSTNFYDAAGRLERVSDPLGNTVRSFYDANGKITNTVDQAGQQWLKKYDQLGRVIEETDPLGDTKKTTYDAANRVKEITTPNGFTSTHEYDGRGRLLKWTDPEGYEWGYRYDGIQNILDITDALGGHYVMTYGPRNERLTEKNQDGFEWKYEYDELLRLKQQTDPNGTTRRLTYDAGGRVLEARFNTDRVNAFDYDENDNPVLLSRSSGSPATITRTRLEYDALDRASQTSDAFGNRIRFGYDPRGLRASLTYPDDKVLTYGYDATGRLTNQVDWAGRQMTYTYDNAGRLVRRTYPNGVVQTNAFDHAGRLTLLSHSTVNPQPSTNSIAIALAYAYDRNGNKTGWSEEGTLRWPLPSLTDEKADYTASGRLIDREITPLDVANPQPVTLNYSYDASGNMTNAVTVGGGQKWTLTYDEDNRTTSIRWETTLTAKHIVNRYDALGRRISRTLDGVETRYALDLAGGMERILCDVNASGAITAWYVHGPDLAYKVDAGDNLTCYHVDGMANIIALSDGAANTIAQYAYTPYGRVVGSTNQQSQSSNPYLFVGSQGVMEELPGLYFMRARYYSAEAAVFLSTDPVKKIGPGWTPHAYVYSRSNPLSFFDPPGEDEWRILGTGADWRTSVEVGSAYAQGLLGATAGVEVSAPTVDLLLNKINPFHRVNSRIDATFSRPALGYGKDFGASLSLVSWRQGERQDWTSFTSGQLSLNVMQGLGLTVSRSDTGKWGFDISYGIGVGSRFLIEREAAQSVNRLAAGRLAGSAYNEVLNPGNGVGLRLRGDLVAGTERAGRYANAANALQGTVSKFASGAISLAAPFMGSFAADAFGRVLPKSTPPVIREAAKLAVATVTTAVVKAAAPVAGAVVGAVAGGIAKGVVAVVVMIFGVPKGLYVLLVFIVIGAAFEYWRYRCRGSPRFSCWGGVMISLRGEDPCR